MAADTRLKAIQKRLGLKADGLLGPVTLSKIEALLDEKLGVQQVEVNYNLLASEKSLQQIVQFEISSEAYYRKYLSSPTWPGADSGVTIGIGYDLGYHTKAQVSSDWRGKVSDEVLENLLQVVGLKKTAAQGALASVNHIDVPLQAAKQVYYFCTLPAYAKKTRGVYSGIEALPADAQGALLSLVFNRGTKMSGSSRREMQAIQPLVQQGDLPGIAEQIRNMKRLWDSNRLRGLHIRRDKEADMVEHARIDYADGELIRV
ncbi:MAG: hypothetical protein AUJ57_08120 [Zetaproteobacteria bacterium CG1_02_53_45]|nr:MAG: hypothetical protein AUJ57_08120 [Zetaproteobacteria bacterium CG1_02_53_45]